MNPTRATPIISADAVAAVRLGLRRAFCRAYLPVTPNSRVGTPSSPTAGPTSTGPSVNTPRTTVIAPSPISGRPSWPDADRPTANDATPAPVSSSPKAARPERRPGAVDGHVAQRGDRTDPAGPHRRHHGRQHADDHADHERRRDRSPTTRRASRLGMSRPPAASSARRPYDSPMPAASPTAAATTPTTIDSSTTERSTWPRRAPMARSMASSASAGPRRSRRCCR